MTMVDPDDDLRQQFDAAGLGPHTSTLLALRRPGVRLISRPSTEAGLELGRSRLGGRADLPAGFEWPIFQDAPLAFVAQIDLAQVHPFDVEGVLPSRGLLSFFYDADELGVWGFDPADRGGWAVVGTPPGVPLERRDHPAGVGEYSRFPAAALSLQTEVRWAPEDSFDIEQVLPTREQRHAYAAVTGQDEDAAEPDEPQHRLLGHPDPIQGDMQTECQLVTHGLYCGDPAAYTGARAEALVPGSGDWRLLLQIDSDDAAGMMWGDVGRLYYWIRHDRLVEQAWDETWLVLQCG